MSDGFLVLLAGVHIVVSGLIYLLIRRGVLHVPAAYAVVVLLVPVFGPAGAAGAEIAGRLPPRRKNPGAAEESAYLPGMIEKDEDNGSVDLVPLEEALLMNDVKTRRAIMMQILQDDPTRYIDQLKAARMNGDMEVAHYATTTIMEIQRDFDTSIQRLNERRDGYSLDEAIGLVGRYIGSGLLDGYSLTQMRELFGELLSRKAGLNPDDREAGMALAYNKIDLGDLSGAAEDLGAMAGQWPFCEEIWLLGLRLAVERRDSRGLEAWLKQMRLAGVRWSDQGRDALQFWLGGVETPVTDSVIDRLAVKP